MSHIPTYQELERRIKELEYLESTRIKAAIEKKAFQEQYRLMSRNIHDVIWAVDMDLKHFYVSPSVKNFSGSSVEEVIKRPLAEHLTQESYAFAVKKFKQELADEKNGQTDPNRSITLELEQYVKDGSTIWTEVKCAFLRNEDNRPVGIIGVTRDITARKRAEDKLREHERYLDKLVKERTAKLEREVLERKQVEEALRESERRFKDITENALEWIWEVDRSGKYTFASPVVERILGFKPAEMLEKHFYDLFLPEDREELKRAAFEMYAKREGFREFINRNVHRNGEIVYLSTSGIPMLDKKGNLLGYRGADADITGRMRMEEEIIRTRKLESLGNLAAGLAHDFNNLLTPILASISIAKTAENLDPEIVEILTDAEKASLRAKGLTHQLLTFAKGGAPIRKTIHLSRMLMDTSRFALSGTNIRCEYSIPDDLWPVEVDGGQISQVIHNMVINAEQAMAEGGILKIYAQNLILGEKEHVNLKKGRYVSVSIEDQGHGIPQEQLSKIFDPFFTIKEKGRGLGLSTSLSIITRHQGHIHVDSKLGVGTTFHIYLPVSEQKPEMKAKRQDNSMRGEGNVLLIDDDEGIRRSARVVLGRLGYRVQTTKDHEEGIKLYEKAMLGKQAFHAVVMDLTIPGSMGGKEAIKKLKKIDRDAKVIVSSGYSDDRTMSEFRKYGFSGVVAKPYEAEDLARVIRDALKGVDG